MVEMMQLNEVEQLSPEVKRRIDIISQLKLGPEQKVQLVLLLLNLKPAATISVLHTPKFDPDGTIASKILKAGLDIRMIEEHKEVTEFAVAHDKETINKILETYRTNDEEFARLVGYPESAIEAYAHKEELMDTKEQEKILADDPDILISFFRFSKNNYFAELEVVKKWNNAIKEYTPEIYNDLKNCLAYER